MDKVDQSIGAVAEDEKVSDTGSVTAKTAFPAIYAGELANLFSGLMIVATAVFFLLILSFAFGFSPGESFPYYLITAALVFGIGAFFGMMYFLFKAEALVEEEERDSEYVINKWRIATMTTTGMPDDIITGLKSILPEKRNAGETPKLVMRRPFGEDAWISKLKELLGEERVDQYQDQILNHTKTRIIA